MGQSNFVSQIVSLMRKHELIVLLAMLIAVAGTWGFVELADEVIEGTTQRFDEAILYTLRQPGQVMPWGPPWMYQAALDLTALGSPSVLFLVTTAALGYLLIKRNLLNASLLLVFAVSGSLLNLLLKAVFSRDRPDLPPLAIFSSWSFPSGHAMLSAIVYLTLGILLARGEQKGSTKLYLISLSFSLTFLVGLTRVYLGVHYPTDVLAGWSAGLVWAILFWVTSHFLGTTYRR
jgi:undecaprenyl-diphosphatase